MRRRKLLLVGLAVLLPAAGAWLLHPSPPDRVALENFRRIEKGMSRAEVYATLGPPGDYRTGPTDQNPSVVPWKTPKRVGVEVGDWEGDVGACNVVFDFGGAGASSFLPVSRTPQTALDNLLWRAKRQWRRWFP